MILDVIVGLRQRVSQLRCCNVQADETDFIYISFILWDL